MNEAIKETLVAQFRAYLEEPGTKLALAPQTDNAPADQFSLFTELTALKAEVKRESRQVKEALDQFKGIFTTLQTGYAALTKELEARQAREKSLQHEALRPLLLQLLELHDRLEAATTSATPPRRKFTAWLCRREQQWNNAQREGQRMTLRRLYEILAEQKVRPLEALGRPLDPHTMRVLETESHPGVAEGIVTYEMRKGFAWEDELLRPAEVRVNKLEQGTR